MTEEDFYRLASERREVPHPTTFRLTVYCYDRNSKGYTRDSKKKEWTLRLWHMSSFYTSKDQAVESLRQYIGSEDANPVHNALIQQICQDRPIAEGDIARWWLFDGAGQEIDHSVCSDIVTEEMTVDDVFFGRKPEEIRFKAGDIVEVLYDDKIYLAILNGAPGTIQEMWQDYKWRCEKWGEPLPDKYGCDHFRESMSDCYYYLTDNLFDPDVPPYAVFNPTFAPTKKAVAELTALYTRWEASIAEG